MRIHKLNNINKARNKNAWDKLIQGFQPKSVDECVIVAKLLKAHRQDHIHKPTSIQPKIDFSWAGQEIRVYEEGQGDQSQF